MKTMKWLIRRELWEHKGMLVWAPAVIAALIAALAVMGAFFEKNINLNEKGSPSAVLANAIEDGERTQIVEILVHTYLGISTPILIVLGFVVFFYCLGALHDERRDRSLLFWKSLPVSDAMTVMSKFLLAAVVAPLISLSIAFALSLIVLIISCVMLLVQGTSLFGQILLTPDMYLMPLRMLGLLPFYVLWALPTIGWLLMVSSMARSKVFLWAVGTPLVAGVLLLWSENSLHLGINAGWFVTNIFSRLLLSAMPGSWMIFDEGNSQLVRPSSTSLSETIFNASWSMLAHAHIWIGAVAGAAMIAVAIWMRRRREEG